MLLTARPSGQLMQLALFAAVYLPAPQLVQAPAAALPEAATNLPVAQLLHSPSAGAALYFPGMQLLQMAAPVSTACSPVLELWLAVYLPALQTMQALVSVLPAAATCLPAGQSSHILVPVPYFPAAHGVQPVDAGCKDAA